MTEDTEGQTDRRSATRGWRRGIQGRNTNSSTWHRAFVSLLCLSRKKLIFILPAMSSSVLRLFSQAMRTGHLRKSYLPPLTSRNISDGIATPKVGHYIQSHPISGSSLFTTVSLFPTVYCTTNDSMERNYKKLSQLKSFLGYYNARYSFQKSKKIIWWSIIIMIDNSWKDEWQIINARGKGYVNK